MDDDRAIFLFKDGAQGWEAKDFLVSQERCKTVVIENKTYFGKYSEEVSFSMVSATHWAITCNLY